MIATDAGHVVESRIGSVLVRATALDRVSVTLPKGGTARIFGVDHDVLNGSAYRREEGWIVGYADRGVFRRRAHAVALLRRTGTTTHQRGSAAAHERAAQVIEALAADLAEQRPGDLIEAEGARLRSCEQVARDVLDDLAAQADAVEACLNVATSGEPTTLDRYGIASWLRDHGRAASIGVDLWRARRSHVVLIVPAGAPPPGDDWEWVR